MSNQFSLSFQDIDTIQRDLIQAGAGLNGGMVIRQDFLPIINDYRQKLTKFWERLKNNRYPAEAPVVQEIRRLNWPTVAFANRGNLTTQVNNPPGSYAPDLSDPGQEVKAIVASFEIDHFAMSMYQQQGRIYGEQESALTDDMIKATLIFLERQLFQAEAAVDPLAFNGLNAQIPAANVFTADVTTDPPDILHDEIDRICVRASMNPNFISMPNVIFCSGAGARLLGNEMRRLQMWQNTSRITPGVIVPSILTTNNDQVDIVPTPFIEDQYGGGTSNDVIEYWICDMSKIEWRGVYPHGGARSFDPQIFDLSYIVNGLPGLAKRMILIYGTPWVRNRGQCVYRLRVTAPPGTAIEPPAMI